MHSSADAASPRHVLLDADGVLQIPHHTPQDAFRPFLGERAEAFLRDAWSEEDTCMAGERDFLPLLAKVLEAYDVTTPVEEVYAATWLRIDPVPASFDLVEELRRGGYGVHLGTNQVRERGEFMRTQLGYDAIFDVSCHSYDLGAAKPSTDFFDRAVALIGAAPAEIVFVDDKGDNVEAAATAGLRAIRWEVADGHDRLRALLADQGVRL